jgi:hypothetical protein
MLSEVRPAEMTSQFRRRNRDSLMWILLSGLLMCAIALAGGVTLLLTEAGLRNLLLPLVVFAAGTLLAGVLFI